MESTKEQLLIILVIIITLFIVSGNKKTIPLPKPSPYSPTPTPKPEPPPLPEVEKLKLDSIPVIRQTVNENSQYAEIINRTRNPVFGYDRSTNGHESIHMLQADLRNAKNMQTKFKPKMNAFYIPTGKVFYVAEPSIRKRDIIPYVPKSLVWSRYKTYISGATSWDDTPLYVIDEWAAYIGGGFIDVEDIENGRHNGQWSDGISGLLEFSVYCSCLCMAIKDKDPDYWANNTQFKLFMIKMLELSHEIYFKGKDLKQLTWDKQENFRQTLINSPDALQLRNFMKTELTDVWLK